ncbi:glycosyl hydrolase 108 family protein [Acinetobacter baumannii 44467_9]|nr:glycosyl hydrolase 108 family protein [Acinetobacter baumannii 44467_9]
MNIEQYLDELIKREGGYVNNPADRGGETKYGITEAVARTNGFKGNMKDLPLDVAKAIYKKQYWTDPRFDQVNVISSLVAEELLDTGVNCGTGFAKPLLQRALNLLNNQGKAGWPDLTVDGIYGQQLLMHSKLIWPSVEKTAKKSWCVFLISCKGNVTLKSVNAILARNSFSMVGSPIELLYESLSLQTIKDSFNNYIAVHSIFRMHSSYDQ